jgi:hypothetical protein
MPPKKDSKKTSSSSKKKVNKKNTSSLTSSTAVSSNNTSSSLHEDALSAPEQLSVNYVLNQALARYKNDATMSDKQQKLKEISHLGNIVDEYLSCFTIIGYTMQGEKVCIFNAKTSKDEAALVDLLRSTFLEIVNNRP